MKMMKFLAVAALLSATIATGAVAQRMGGPNGWSPWAHIGTSTFVGFNDSDGTIGGWAGRNIVRLALRSNYPAACSRVVATFGNGERVDLSGHGSVQLRAENMNQFDLPGNRRNLTSLYLRCHGANGHPVNIAAFGRKPL